MVAPLAGSVDNFYPRPPRGGRLKQADASGKPTIFLPTPSARRATKTPTSSLSASAISTHALREEGDARKADVYLADEKFLPTPSARRATVTAMPVTPV